MVKTDSDARTLTPRQMEVMRCIRAGRRANGYSPTLQEIADQLGISKITVFEHVEALLRKGLVTRRSNKARSLELTAAAKFPEDRPTVIPLVGRIAAGMPVEAYEDRDTFDLESTFVTPHQRIAIRVRGDSMIDEHICDGDVVIVEQRSDVRDGDIVVALADGENTLKAIYRERGRIRLQPANGNYPPIYPKECQVQGVVIGVVRQYAPLRRRR
ncbi:MAG: transcriptional repressor LexA [Phycisphaerales bacterium]|nr:MAG: transcriptional repressor LexA [Phycisphaerales bacterium]